MTDAGHSTVIVVGAGVIGLTTAIRLLERRSHIQVHMVAQCFPGDNKNIEYTSPWAGAHHVSHSSPSQPELAALEKETFEILTEQLHSQETSALMAIDQYEHYMSGSDNGSNPDGLKLLGMPGFRELKKEELPEGFTSGLTFKTLTIDTPIYLDYLLQKFKSLGGTVHQAKLESLRDAQGVIGLKYPPALIVNSTGLGSLDLKDVADKELFPTRGQLCIIRAPWMKYGKTFTGPGSTSYTIPRSSGLVIVGGTRDADDWHTTARPETTKLILERALKYDRNILPPEKRENGTIEDIDLMETGCGRRPSRKGGVRLELDKTGPIPVLHNYGHGGFGWQSSWGYARAAVDLAAEVL